MRTLANHYVTVTVELRSVAAGKRNGAWREVYYQSEHSLVRQGKGCALPLVLTVQSVYFESNFYIFYSRYLY